MLDESTSVPDNEERYGKHTLPSNWRSLPENLKRRVFQGWTKREYKKYIGAIPSWMQKREKKTDEDDE